MTKIFFWRTLAVVALVIVCSIVMSIAKAPLQEFQTENGLQLQIQPSAYPGTVGDFVRPTNDFTDSARLFFATDMVFTISYVMLFAAIFTVLRQHQAFFAYFGLAFAIMSGLFDLIENSIYLSYAIRATNGVPLENPAILLLSTLTTLKWVSLSGVFIAYAFAFPLKTWAGKLSAITLVIVPLVVLGGYAFPEWEPYKNSIFILPLPFVLYYLWKQTK